MWKIYCLLLRTLILMLIPGYYKYFLFCLLLSLLATFLKMDTTNTLVIVHKQRRVMFLHLSVTHCVHMGGVYLSACWHTHTPRADTPSGQTPPRADTPPVQCMLGYTQPLVPSTCWDRHGYCADGTQPTGTFLSPSIFVWNFFIFFPTRRLISSAVLSPHCIV